MIVRDEYGFIGQVGVFADGTPNTKDLDFGDCAGRTGILAMCDSERDKELLPAFINRYSSLLMRYPGQAERGYDDPSQTSRDQLICWVAGNNNACSLSYAQAGYINKDVLGFDVRLYLYKAAQTAPPIYIKTLGMIQLPLSILWSCLITPDHELNQLICMLSQFDSKWTKMMVRLHPDWKKNLTDYWNGWRNMPEISEMLINYVNNRIT